MRSIKNRLALLFFALTLGAVGVMYGYVIPQLESTLRNEKLRTLAEYTRIYSDGIVVALRDGNANQINGAVARAAERASARVTLFAVSTGTRFQVYAQSDSTSEIDLAGRFEAIALRAARARLPIVGTETQPGADLAEAARPIVREGDRRVNYVVVYSLPLSDVQRNVALIRRQVIVAGAIALLVALLAGYFAARAIAERVRRLERAAERVAAGDFSTPIPVDSDDELGQLARAFDVMQRQVAQLDRARKQFIATASHELRTPLFSLSGFVELLTDEELDEETRKRFLAQLRVQVERLQKLAIDLLDLSKLEAGSLELRAEPTDVGALARDIAMEFTPALGTHDSHLEVRLAREGLQAVCDRERVAQIIRILVDNALTHTPSGTGIVVSARRADGEVVLAVSDDGPGIADGEIARIFEPFYTSDDARGSGLGLAIARELAEHMNGRLDVEAQPHGTTFTLELPA